MNFNIDTSIVVVFLALNLFMGLYAARGQTTIKEYAVGNRNFSTATIAATLIATWIGGSSLAIKVSESYTKGLYYISTGLIDPLSFLIIAYLFAPRMSRFLGSLSVAEAMGNLYGKTVRVITAISGVVGTIGFVSVQFKVSANLFNYFLGIDGLYATLISSAIVVFYSSYCGIRAVTLTDIIQLFTFCVFIPGLALLIWGTLNNPTIVFNTLLHHPLLDYRQVFDFSTSQFLSWLGLLIFLLIPGFDPAVFQRIAMSKNTTQIKQSFTLASITCLIIGALMYWIGILLLSSEKALDPDQLIGYVIDNYSYPGLIGFTIVGILAMVMSTADSYINSSAILIAHDICKPLGLKIAKSNEVMLSRICAVIIGIAAIIPALSSRSLLDLILITFSFYMPIVTVPLILAILGFQSTSKAVLIGMSAGLITVIIFNIFDIGVDSAIPGLLANLIFFMGSHYLLKQPGGWINVDTKGLNTAKRQRVRKLKNILQSIKGFNFLLFCKNNSPKQEYVYSIFGLFCIISIFSTMYSLPIDIRDQNKAALDLIYHSVLILSTIFLSYPIWPPTFRKETFITVLWLIGIFYMLIFVGGLLVIISNFAQLQLMIFMVNLIVIASLLRWKIAVLMSFTGILSAMEFYKYYKGMENISAAIDISLQFKIMYTLLLVSSVLIAFLKPKQEEQQLTEEKNGYLNGRLTSQEEQLTEALMLRGEFIRNVSHEYHAPMTGITSMAETLVEAYHKLNDQQRLLAAETILKSSRSLDAFDSNISSLSKLSKGTYDLKIESLDFSNLVYERIETCRKLYEENKEDREFILDIEENIVIRGDRKLIIQVLDNLVINSITYCKKGKITITLKQDETGINLILEDEGIGIPTKELYDIFEPFTVSSRTRTPAGGRGVGLAVCKRVIEAHGGSVKAESDGIKGATFTLTLPKVSD